MEEHKVIADDGRVLWAADSGRGRPLVLCHGGPGPWDMFDGLAALLADRVRVIRWYRRGGGRPEPEGPGAMARALADLDAVRVHFGLPRTALLGHSRGAGVALHYALAHPERVSSLVCVSGAGLGQDRHGEHRRDRVERPGGVGVPVSTSGDAAVRSGTTDFADPTAAGQRAEEFATPRFGAHEEDDAAWDAESRPWDERELVARCRELDVPTLIVDGAADVRPRWVVDSLADALPDVARVVLPGAGHLPWVESPGSFGWAVLAHLAR